MECERPKIKLIQIDNDMKRNCIELQRSSTESPLVIQLIIINNKMLDKRKNYPPTK